ncbi:MAG: hypothetical protein ACHQAQ_11065 [Hyphomicrobiales bacterium]
MSAPLQRDIVGFGAHRPDPKWPGGARLAINFVMNYEEGSEPSVQDGEGFTETSHTEIGASNTGVQGRDLAGEGMFAYGSRVGFWRLMRLFQERSLPLTVFGCALALERNAETASAAFDMLYREGKTQPKMMSVGLHMRVIGHPARAAGLERFLDYVMRFEGVWIARRADIAGHWAKAHPPG